MKKLKEESGREESNSRLVSFLYELMRDHLPCGTVEHILGNSIAQPVAYTNGYLVRYAKNIAEQLKVAGEPEVEENLHIKEWIVKYIEKEISRECSTESIYRYFCDRALVDAERIRAALVELVDSRTIIYSAPGLVRLRGREEDNENKEL